MPKHAMKGVDGFVRCKGEFFEFDPMKIHVDPEWNYRKDFTGHEELMAQIKENGVLTPLRVRKKPDGTIWLRNGERRLRAVKELIENGFPILSVPVSVAPRGQNDLDAYLEAYIGNDSKAPTPTEEAAAFRRMKAWGMKVQDISKKTGRSESHVRNRLKLADGMPEVLKAVDDGEIPVTAAQKIIEESDGSAAVQMKKLKKKKADPNPMRAPKPITCKIVKGVAAQNGNNKVRCAPVLEMLKNQTFMRRLRELGYDEQTIVVKVRPLPSPKNQDVNGDHIKHP